MPTYALEIEYETTRIGRVQVNFQSSDGDLTKAQLKTFMAANANEPDLAETLEAGEGNHGPLSLTAIIKKFKKLDKDHPQPDLNLDDYEIPEEE